MRCNLLSNKLSLKFILKSSRYYETSSAAYYKDAFFLGWSKWSLDFFIFYYYFLELLLFSRVIFIEEIESHITDLWHQNKQFLKDFNSLTIILLDNFYLTQRKNVSFFWTHQNIFATSLELITFSTLKKIFSMKVKVNLLKYRWSLIFKKNSLRKNFTSFLVRLFLNKCAKRQSSPLEPKTF